MEIPVLIEPTSTGFRATTGGPLHLIAEGASEVETLAVMSRQLADWTKAGRGKIVGVAAERGDIATFVSRFADDPFIAEWAEATREVRREREAEEQRLASPDA